MSTESLRRYILQFREWLDACARTVLRGERSVVESWSDDADAAERLLDEKPELPIAFLGPSQQGKSSLINAILGESILPVGAAIGACTCVITSVRYEEGNQYRAEIDFISKTDWANELRVLHEVASSVGTIDDDADDEEERQATIAAAREKFEAVYRNTDIGRIPEILDDPNLCLPEDVANAMAAGRALVLQHDKALPLRNAIRKYLVGRDQQRDDAQLWPVISRVKVDGPFEVLSNGAVLVDLPGLNDPNPAREQVTKRYLEDARYLWLICNSQTGIDRTFTRLLRDGGLLFRLFLEGRLDVFSVVTTRFDDINIAAVLEQMRLDPDDFDGDVTPVLSFRKQEIVTHVAAALADIATDVMARAETRENQSAFLDAVRSVPVFPVATAAYLHDIGKMPLYQGIKLPSAETGLPRLLDHLHSITLEKSRQSRIQGSSRRLRHLQGQASRFFLGRVRQIELDDDAARERWLDFARAAQDSISAGRDALAKVRTWAEVSLGERRTSFDRRLAELEPRADRNLEATLSSWQEINWRTLRSIVEHDGVWVRTSPRKEFDLNRDLAHTYLGLIPGLWDDFFGAQMGGLVDEVVRRSLDELRLTVGRLDGAMRMLNNQPGGMREVMETSLATAQQSFDLRAGEARADLAAHIQRTRQGLVTGMVTTAGKFMHEAYGNAADVPGGTGVKRRMLDALVPYARTRAPTLFIAIRRDLADGVNVLESSMKPRLGRIIDYALGVLDQIEQNVSTRHAGGSEQISALKAALDALPKLDSAFDGVGLDKQPTSPRPAALQVGG
ncbi:hypothetical protein RHODGE_RHODGE_02921 [Rhodoplanes serenus]|uniref:Dynamin N-terminal domain-containing protein n=1 Tax=Rhodoplanes serenus TaxID=200615 RepID=A0A3S4B230_9BRAD|nr:dynamin family protein [Rhodoplanes serenus]VCU09752.1 hypothetical protein RHODGE_RHODGE_02921 [Rhodoplanes serenus]